jgi:hypothetical protein
MRSAPASSTLPTEALIRSGDPLEEARPLLSEYEYARAVEEGRAMTLEEAVAYALVETRDPQVSPA